MTLITWNDGGPLFKDGKVASEEGCCCGGKCGRCIIDGEWDCRYTTREQCEQCDTTVICQNLETVEERIVSDCSECDAETEWCYSMTEGPCGTWDANAECEPCPCEQNSDCPDGQYCCDGVCREPICPTVKYFHIVFHFPAVPGPAGTSKVCDTNLSQLLVNPCGTAVLTRAVSYGPFFNCTLSVSAELGAGCVLQNIVVTQSSGGTCDENRPQFIEIVEIGEEDCETVFIPD